MIKTSTPTQNLNYLNQHADNLSGELLNDLDLMLYEQIRPQLDQLKREPEQETIDRILAYSSSL